MPGWLRAIAHVNPLTYVVDGLRSLMLSGATSTLGLGRDFAVLAVCLIALGCPRRAHVPETDRLTVDHRRRQA